MKQHKYPLIVYRRYHEVHRGLSLVLMIAGALLMVAGALVPVLRSRNIAGDGRLLITAGVVMFAFGLARYLLTFWISRAAYVEPTPRNVKIQTPVAPIVFSYSRIMSTRPTNLRDVFPPEKQKGARRRILEGQWGETVIVLDLKAYPMSRQTLRWLLGPFLLVPKGTGFVFLVKDWMALNRQLADYHDQWRQRTMKKATR